MDLPRAQVFYIYQAFEVVVVYKHKNFMLIAFKVMLLGFTYFNNGQQLAIIDILSYLSRNHLLKKKGY